MQISKNHQPTKSANLQKSPTHQIIENLQKSPTHKIPIFNPPNILKIPKNYPN